MSKEIAEKPEQRSSKPSLVEKFASKYGVDSDKMLNTLKQTAFKQSNNGEISNEQMMSLMIVADQYGLNPFTKEIFAYPDKGGIVPVVSVDGWSRIINENPQMDGIEFEYSPETVDHKGKTCHVWIDCIIYRKDRSRPIRVREFFEEVVRSVSFATPWDSHPKRMHRHKTEIQCARVAFGFAGIYDQDEAERIIEARSTDIAGEYEVEQMNTSLPAYPAEDFETNFPKWQAAIESGKRTPEQIIAMVRSKAELTNSQHDQIMALAQNQSTEKTA